MGTGLGLVSFATGKEESSLEERQTEGLLYGLASTASAITGVHLVGNATGIPALENLGGKILMKNPILAGGIAATGVAAGAYYAYTHKPAEKEIINCLIVYYINKNNYRRFCPMKSHRTKPF